MVSQRTYKNSDFFECDKIVSRPKSLAELLSTVKSEITDTSYLFMYVYLGSSNSTGVKPNNSSTDGKLIYLAIIYLFLRECSSFLFLNNSEFFSFSTLRIFTCSDTKLESGMTSYFWKKSDY